MFLCFMLKMIYIYKKCLCKSIFKAEVDQEPSEASGMQLFMAEVSSWKLLTIDVEDFALDVMWSLDFLLNMYLFLDFLIN